MFSALVADVPGFWRVLSAFHAGSYFGPPAVAEHFFGFLFVSPRSCGLNKSLIRMALSHGSCDRFGFSDGVGFVHITLFSTGHRIARRYAPFATSAIDGYSCVQ